MPYNVIRKSFLELLKKLLKQIDNGGMGNEITLTCQKDKIELY